MDTKVCALFASVLVLMCGCATSPERGSDAEPANTEAVPKPSKPAFVYSSADLPDVEFGKVLVSSTPPGAEVMLDGQNVGNTPCEIQLGIERRVSIEVRMSGHRNSTSPLFAFNKKGEAHAWESESDREFQWVVTESIETRSPKFPVVKNLGNGHLVFLNSSMSREFGSREIAFASKGPLMHGHVFPPPQAVTPQLRTRWAFTNTDFGELAIDVTLATE